MIKIKPLNNTSLDDLYIAWMNAFQDYERSWSRIEFENMLIRNGYTPEYSFGAFDNEKLVSFTLNAIGDYNSIRTAYDTGTGTIKEYRDKGLASNIFMESIPLLKQAGIRQYLLEVIQTNEKAISVYLKLGFEKTRELNYYIQDISAIRLNSKFLSNEFYFEEIDFMDIDNLNKITEFLDSWQNNYQSISRIKNNIKIIGVFLANDLIAYGIIEPYTGDIPELFVENNFRRKGIGSALLKELIKLNKSTKIKLINVDKKNHSMNLFIENNGISKMGSQFEMMRKL